jgi:hypothetical protein
MSEWRNLGDVNFMEYGGVLVKQDDEVKGQFEFIQLHTEVDGDADKKILITGVFDADSYEQAEAIVFDDNGFDGFQLCGSTPHAMYPNFDDPESLFVTDAEIAQALVNHGASEYLDEEYAAVYEKHPEMFEGDGLDSDFDAREFNEQDGIDLD